MLADGVGTLSVGVQRAAECIQCIGESPSSLERVAAGCIQQLSMTRHAGGEFPFARWQSPGEWRITGRRIAADRGGSWRIMADHGGLLADDGQVTAYVCMLLGRTRTAASGRHHCHARGANPEGPRTLGLEFATAGSGK